MKFRIMKEISKILEKTWEITFVVILSLFIVTLKFNLLGKSNMDFLSEVFIGVLL